MQALRKLTLIVVMVLFFTTTGFAASPQLSHKTLKASPYNVYAITLKNGTAASWTTSKPKVVQIAYKDSNLVILRAKKKGSAKITAKVGSKSLSCKVTVKPLKGIPKEINRFGWR